jgi:hypothetical protein
MRETEQTRGLYGEALGYVLLAEERHPSSGGCAHFPPSLHHKNMPVKGKRPAPPSIQVRSQT